MSRVLKLHSGQRICECVFSMVYLLVVFRTLFLLFIGIYYKRTFWCMLPFLFHLKSMICEFSFQILNKSQTKANQEKNSIDKRVSLILSCHIKSRKLSCRHILALALSRLFILDVCLLISVFFFYFHDVFQLMPYYTHDKSVSIFFPSFFLEKKHPRFELVGLFSSVHFNVFTGSFSLILMEKPAQEARAREIGQKRNGKAQRAITIIITGKTRKTSTQILFSVRCVCVAYCTVV